MSVAPRSGHRGPAAACPIERYPRCGSGAQAVPLRHRRYHHQLRRKAVHSTRTNALKACSIRAGGWGGRQTGKRRRDRGRGAALSHRSVAFPAASTTARRSRIRIGTPCGPHGTGPVRNGQSRNPTPTGMQGNPGRPLPLRWAAALIDRAEIATSLWLRIDGLHGPSTPPALFPHHHNPLPESVTRIGARP